MRRCIHLALLFCLVSAGAARALDIQLEYEVGDSDQPFYDKEGKALMSIMDEAARRWEDIIVDNHTIKVYIRYEDIANSSTLATASTLLTNSAGNRVTEGRLRFDTPRTWYFDPTPRDDSEFDMAPRELFELTSNQKAVFFEGGPALEPLLEVAYSGASNGTDPNAGNGLDVLSTAMHELGHLLGITDHNLPAGDAEIADFDFDLPPSLLGGRVMAARTAKNDDGDPEPHLAYTGALLAPNTSGGRQLPAALDVLAAASVSNWSKADLPRQDFLTGSTWGNDGSWEGNLEPDGDDHAYIRHGGDVHLNNNVKVQHLTLNGSSNLFTGAHDLIVNGTTSIEFDGAIPFSQLFVESGGSFTTENLEIDTGEVDLSGGGVLVNGTTTNRGGITGHGSFRAGVALVNYGTISAADDQLLTLYATSPINAHVLDGGLGDGRVNAIGGDLKFVGSVEPVFTGTMTISDGRSIEFDDSWVLAPGGLLELDSAGSDYAVLRMPELTILSTVDVDKLARIDAAVSTSPDTVINLPDADDRLELGTTRSQSIGFNGGLIQGAGTLVQNGDASVDPNRAQTISVATFDWDGTTASSTTVGSGAFLNLNVGQLADTMDGDVFLDAGHLRVSTPAAWAMRGTMFFDGNSSVLDGADINLVAGGELRFRTGSSYVDAAINSAGRITADAPATLYQPLTLQSSSVTQVNQGGELFLENDVLYRGGSITGAGTIHQNGAAVVSADQTIAMLGVFDWDGTSNNSSFTVETGNEFHLSAKSLNPTHDIYSGALSLFGSLASVDVDDDQWMLGGQISLVAGAKGEGSTLAGDPLDVTGQIVATGAATHSVEMRTRFLSVDSSLNVGSGTTVEFNAPVFFPNGSHSSLGEIVVNQTGEINGGDVATVDFTVGAGASFKLIDGRLRAGEVTDLSGAGDGIGLSGGVLQADVFRGDLLNEGATIAPGVNSLARGRTTVDGDFEQNADGTLAIQIAGDLDFDNLKVVGDATLGGRLDVDLLDSFEPQLGDRFKIVTASSVLGEFLYLSLPTLAGELTWEVTYEPDLVSLDVIDAVFEGDYNNDGVVDTADYATWRNQVGATRARLYNETVTLGVATIEDYQVWRANYGNFKNAVPTELATVPAPTAVALAMMMLAAPALAASRTR